MSDDLNHDDPRLPPSLAEDLSALYGRAPRVPAEVDRAVLNRARAHLARRGRLRLLLRAGGAGAAVAAALLLAAWLFTDDTPQPLAPEPVIATATPADLNADGVVDVLDALRLARQLEAQDDITAPDLTGDGTVDRADVDAIAMAAVRIDLDRRAVQ